MRRIFSIFVLLVGMSLLMINHPGIAGGKKDDSKGANKGKHHHPHIEKMLHQLHEAREQVLHAIKAEEKEKKIDPTVHRELVKSMDDVNLAIAHARSALGLEKLNK